MKPHKETWEVDEFVIRVLKGDRKMALLSASSLTRARLAAQAPAMARLLLATEYVGDSGRYRACVHCGGWDPDDERIPDPPGEGHRDDCEFVRVLRDAGVLEEP